MTKVRRGPVFGLSASVMGIPVHFNHRSSNCALVACKASSAVVDVTTRVTGALAASKAASEVFPEAGGERRRRNGCSSKAE